MLNIIRSFLALLIATTFLCMGNGLLNSLLSINMRLQGSSDQVIGLVMSCNYLGIILGIFFCQPLVRHVGHIRSFAAFGAVIGFLITVVSLAIAMLGSTGMGVFHLSGVHGAGAGQSRERGHRAGQRRLDPFFRDRCLRGSSGVFFFNRPGRSMGSVFFYGFLRRDTLFGSLGISL